VTEVLQLFTADRDPEAADWLMDATGATAGLLLAELGLWLQRRLGSARRRRQAAADPDRQTKL
jgi:VanZ family protein